MAPETISFMPDGDITLLLTRQVYQEVEPSNSSSIPSQTIIDEDKLIEEALGIEPDAPEKEDESFLFFAPDAPGSNDGPMFPPAPRGRRGTWESEQRERSRSPPAGFWARLKRQSEAVEDTVVDTEAKSNSDPATNGKEEELKVETKERVLVSSHEVHCIVSSRHLILASQFFQLLLTGDSTFATSLRLGQHVKISLPTVDLETMVILLNIVHGLSRKVPRQVDLVDLSQLAVLARKFGMQDTVQFFSDTWIDAAQRDGLPKAYEEDGANIWWFIYVFWVFDRESEFKEMTKVVQRKCGDKVENDVKDVPVPKIIIDTISRDREFAIETALTVIHTLITRYMDGDAICDSISDDDIKYACDAMVLGSLIKGSKKIGFWPRPVSPFEGKRFQDLATEIREIRVLDVCGKGRRGTFGNNCHGLQDEIGKSMRDIEMGLDGLEVADFKMDNRNFEEAWQLLGPLPPTPELEGIGETTIESPALAEEETPILAEEKRTEPPNGHYNSQRTKLSIPSLPSPVSTPGPAKKDSYEPYADVSRTPTSHPDKILDEKPVISQADNTKQSDHFASNAVTRLPLDEAISLPQERLSTPRSSTQTTEQNSVLRNSSQVTGENATSVGIQQASVPPSNPPQRKELPVREKCNGNQDENDGCQFKDLTAISQVSEDIKSRISSAESPTASPVESSRHVQQEEFRKYQDINNAERVKSPARNIGANAPEQYSRHIQQEELRNSRDLNVRQRIQSPQRQQQIVNRLRDEQADVRQRSIRSSPVSDSPIQEPRVPEREKTLTHQFSRDFQDGGARISPRNSGERVARQNGDVKQHSIRPVSHHQEVRLPSNGTTNGHKEAVKSIANERGVIEPWREARNGETRAFPTKSPPVETRMTTNGEKASSVSFSLLPQDTKVSPKQNPKTSDPQAFGGQLNTKPGRRDEVRTPPKDSKILSSTNLNHSSASNIRELTEGEVPANPIEPKSSQPNLEIDSVPVNKPHSPFRESKSNEIRNPSPNRGVSPPETEIDIDRLTGLIDRVASEDGTSSVKDSIIARISTTTAGEDTWTPQQIFKMRKSKKKFSTRF